MTVLVQTKTPQELKNILKEQFFNIITLAKSASSLTNSKEAKKCINDLTETLFKYTNGSNTDILNSFQIILLKLHSLRAMGRLNKLSRDIFQYLYQDIVSMKKVCDYYNSQNN